MLTTSRFNELDFYIVQKACQHGTPVVLVITKVDQEIIKECDDFPEKSLEQATHEVLSELKESVREKLREVNPNLTDVPIYAVSATKLRKELSGQKTNDCSSLEMWPLIDYCLETAKNQRVPTMEH